MLDLCEQSTNAVIGAWTRGKSFEECLAHVREAVTPYQARIAELEVENARLREAFEQHASGKVRVEYWQQTDTRPRGYWAALKDSLQPWHGPFPTPLEAVLAAMEAKKGKALDKARALLLAVTDERREGDLDLADMIGSYLWDACEGDDLGFLERISQKAIDGWEKSIRELLNRHRVNLFFDSAGNLRRPKELD